MSHKSNVILLLLYFSWSNVSCRFSIMVLTKLSILRMRYLMVSYIHVHSLLHSREEKSSETYLQRIDARATTVFCSLHAFRISRIRISQFQRTFLSSEKWILLNFTNLNIIQIWYVYKIIEKFFKICEFNSVNFIYIYNVKQINTDTKQNYRKIYFILFYLFIN